MFDLAWSQALDKTMVVVCLWIELRRAKIKLAPCVFCLVVELLALLDGTLSPSQYCEAAIVQHHIWPAIY
jgi:hypothetical protein